MTKILIVEDDFLMAEMTRESLVEHGYMVCGIAGTVDEAVALARLHRPDLILLDLRLKGGKLGTEVAAQLGSIDGLGILYASGDFSQVRLTAADGHASLDKPFRPHELIRGLELVSSLVRTGSANLPFPRGFHFLQPFGLGTRDAHA